MNKHLIYCFLILSSFSAPSFSQLVMKGNFWQCTTHDASNVQWAAQSPYRKVALNFVYDACKKNSQSPATCKTSTIHCEQYVDGMNITPMWRCTAFDRQAQPWRSNFYSRRVDAALAAKSYCMHNSAVPYTCSINLITCINKNEM